MSKADFKKTPDDIHPPANYSAWQTACWHAAKGNWDAAHHIAQQHEGEKAFDHLHACLHRIEGDEYNALYWYRRAGVKMPDQNADEEVLGLLETY